ncbi:hypothetical protein [Dactylosporangium cerinum]
MKAGTLVGGTVLTGLVGGLSQIAGVPWGAVVAVVVLGLLFTFMLGLAQVLVPQESHDKVLFWERVLTYWDRRRTTMSLQDRPPLRLGNTATEQDMTVIPAPRSATSNESAPARSP